MHNIQHIHGQHTFNYPARLQLKIPQTLQDSIGGVLRIPLQSFMTQRIQKTHSFCQASNSEKGGSQEDLKHLASSEFLSSSCG